MTFKNIAELEAYKDTAMFCLCGKLTQRGSRYITNSGNCFHKECIKEDKKSGKSRNKRENK